MPRFSFDFENLKAGRLGVTGVYGSLLAEAASYCLYINDHSNPVLLSVTGDLVALGHFRWGDITLEHRRTWADTQEATEYGAYGIAIVVALQMTQLPCVERSAKGPGIDYWLGTCADDPGIFQRVARLEVCGILKGREADISARVH